jgi:hypothetical protein
MPVKRLIIFGSDVLSKNRLHLNIEQAQLSRPKCVLLYSGYGPTMQ